MGYSAALAAAGMHLVDGCLIAPAPDELDDAAFLLFKQAVLGKVHTESIRRVLIDVSPIHVLDSVCFTLLTDCARLLSLLGARAVFVGFQAGVVSALIDLDVRTDDIVSARTLEDGFDLFRSMDVDPSDDGEPHGLADDGGDENDDQHPKPDFEPTPS
jgi:anti-anti-sigma regulatory factor